MNQITLTGNLTQKPVTTRSHQGKVYSKFSIAVAKPRAAGEEETGVDFFKITAFGQHAEFLAKYADKGDKIMVRGRMDLGLFKSDDGATIFNPSVEVGRDGEVELLHKVDRTNRPENNSKKIVPF